MYAVAVVELGGPVEAEAAALASDLGVTPYEVRLTLTAGLPAIILTTAQRERADAVVERIVGRKHGALVSDIEAVVPSTAMVQMRRFGLEADAATVEDPGVADPRLEYEDILVMVRAQHRWTEVAVEQIRERKFRPGAAILTGGAVMTKKTVRQVQTKQEEREEVLYVFRRSGATPWLLHETAQYQGLGADLVPTRHGNFLTTIRLLRERARFAKYDDRLLAHRRVPALGSNGEGEPETLGIDLLAHVLAVWVARESEPYRG